MAVTRPGQVEWNSVLFDVAPGDSGVWIPRSATRSGWHPRTRQAVYETEAGGVAGRPLWEPMYPAIDGVACDSAEALLNVISAMEPFGWPEPGTLTWFSFELDQVLTVDALPYRCVPVENDDSEHQPTRFVDVAWIVGRPGDIFVEPGS